jgi:hypothetical protein
MRLRIAIPWLACLLLWAPACGPSDETDDDDDSDGGVEELPDEDGDGIADVHEGRGGDVDTNDDGTPDYLDDDSDGDGIPDYREAGDELSGTPPVDSDGDGDPDFRDLDSDDNGIADGIDNTEDVDSDGIGNWQDLDDDDDGMADEYEVGEDPSDPTDTDNDGAADFQDTDSDDDDVLDMYEGFDDFDGDGSPNFRDTDADDDCVPDGAEAGGVPPLDTDDDGRFDFLDRDSDDDGLSDQAEDANCNGVQDAGESSPTDGDSDDDGVSDLVETAANTDPTDANDNPQANGDFVFIVPYEEPPTPEDDDLDFSTNLVTVDVYVLIDRSGSMSGEITSVRDNIAGQLELLTCPPLGSGSPADCIADLWSGSGTFGYEDGAPYTNHLDVQSNPDLTGPAIATAEPGSSSFNESHLLATWSTVTGQGTATSGCSPAATYGPRVSCATSPAGASGIGYPCFRPNALPIILLATDEAPTATFNCPTIPTVAAAANAIGAKVIGVRGSSPPAQVTTDLNALANQTDTIDGSGNPIVVDGANAGAATAIGDGIRTLANSTPLDVEADPVDDPIDLIDAVASFVDHLETLQLGTPECTSGLTDEDTNSDGFDDRYVDVTPGTPVCWRLIPKSNTTVEATEEPQLFHATVEVFGDGVTLLDTRDVFFLIPPVNIDEPIP